MTTPSDVRDAIRALIETHAPTITRGRYFEAPTPLVRIPADLLPAKSVNGKAYAEAQKQTARAEAALIAADDALDAATTDNTARQAATARRDDVAQQIARGDAGPEAAESLLPSYTDGDLLSRVETLALAVGHARKNLTAAVAAENAAAADLAPEIAQAAVDKAAALDDEAKQAEATAAAARARANSASSLTRELWMPQARAALVAAGVRPRAGETFADRARNVVNVALTDPATGAWSADPKRYADYDSRTARSATADALGIRLDVAPLMSESEFRAECRRVAALGQPVPAVPPHLAGIVL